jgi:leucyl/phenylalanyl-tRNA--protein transferase
MIPWLDENTPFPDVGSALSEPNGLLAAGGDLSPARLLAAYRRGIFPWFSPGDPILWWSPDPRMVLAPQDIRLARSMAKTLRNKAYEVRFDSRFDLVIAACAGPRQDHGGTWITAEMQDAYMTLHKLGLAHSVEVWMNDQLAGGLYGVAVGNVFFGESMFSWQRDASKIALIALARHAVAAGIALIDCQMHTQHLESMGARPVSRSAFCSRLKELVDYPRAACSWAGASYRNDPAERRLSVTVAADDQ